MCDNILARWDRDINVLGNCPWIVSRVVYDHSQDWEVLCWQGKSVLPTPQLNRGIGLLLTPVPQANQIGLGRHGLPNQSVSM